LVVTLNVLIITVQGYEANTLITCLNKQMASSCNVVVSMGNSRCYFCNNTVLFL